MSRAIINIYECIQDDQSLGPDNVAMTSRITFDLQVGETTYKHCWVKIDQPFGSDFQTDTINVGLPNGYPEDLPWNHERFADQIRKYFRATLTGSTQDVRLRSSARGNRDRNKRSTVVFAFELELSD